MYKRQGDAGPTGAAGAKGPTGNSGNAGIQGPTGNTGDRGPEATYGSTFPTSGVKDGHIHVYNEENVAGTLDQRYVNIYEAGTWVRASPNIMYQETANQISSNAAAVGMETGTTTVPTFILWLKTAHRAWKSFDKLYGCSWGHVASASSSTGGTISTVFSAFLTCNGNMITGRKYKIDWTANVGLTSSAQEAHIEGIISINDVNQAPTGQKVAWIGAGLADSQPITVMGGSFVWNATGTGTIKTQWWMKGKNGDQKFYTGSLVVTDVGPT